MLCSVHTFSPSCQSVLDAFRSIDPSLSPNSTHLIFSPLGLPYLALTSASHTQTTANTRFLLGRSTQKVRAKIPRRFRHWPPLRQQICNRKMRRLLGLAGIISMMMVMCSLSGQDLWRRHLMFGLSRRHKSRFEFYQRLSRPPFSHADLK